VGTCRGWSSQSKRGKSSTISWPTSP